MENIVQTIESQMNNIQSITKNDLKDIVLFQINSMNDYMTDLHTEISELRRSSESCLSSDERNCNDHNFSRNRSDNYTNLDEKSVLDTEYRKNTVSESSPKVEANKISS
ncbi:Uncharacterised protein r2_g2117 [Pycnogonum litorale]